MPHELRLSTRDIRWRGNPDYAPFLSAKALPDPRELSHSGAARLIKKSAGRMIFEARLEAGGGTVDTVVKVYRHRGAIEWLKANFLGTKARTEWRILNAARERGLPVVDPVAYGERRRAGFLRESVLLTRRVDASMTLREALFSSEVPFPRRRVIRQLAEVISEMHDRGIHHRDLHPGNFLIHRDNAGTLGIAILDLHRARAGAPLSWRRRISSLAQFNMFATMALDDRERTRFLLSYLSGTRHPYPPRRRLFSRIETRTMKMRRRLWKRREKRCVGTNNYFRPVSMAKLKGFASAALWDDVFTALFPGTGNAVLYERLIKRSGSKELREFHAVTPRGTRRLVLKHYRRKRGMRDLLYRFRSSGAMRAWRGAHRLSMREIATPPAIAVLEERGVLRRLRNAFLLMEKLEGVENLVEHVARRHARYRDDRAALRRLVTQLARFIRLVHARGIYHADCKATNFLLREEADGDYRFFLSDLDHCYARRAISSRKILRNLLQLNNSFPDLSLIPLRERCRFVAWYLGNRRRDEWRHWWKRLCRDADRRMTRRGKHFVEHRQ